jgi:uncharacterized repeat protein (TIGR01451 family)
MAVHQVSHRLSLLVTVALVAGLMSLGVAPALADATISSSGPLTSVFTSDDLNCAVNHTGDSVGEFYGTTACATLVASGGTLFGPANIPAGGAAAPRTAFTPVSQSAVTGAGTAADPYTVTTTVQAGSPNLVVVQTDSYVVGEESFRTDVTVQNSGATAQSALLYRAGDCFLQDSDLGFGRVDGAAVACVASDGGDPPAPGTRIEQWFPISSGSHYLEDLFSTVWATVGSQANFPDTCRCSSSTSDYIDNGAGLSWSFSIPANGSVTRSSLITFSPLGTQPLSMSKTADQTSVAPGASDGYTISVNNPNGQSATLSSISDTLPAGFSYVPGSTSGITAAEPTAVGQQLTWNGPFAVGAGASISLHFAVTVSNTPGTYMNEASGTAESLAVVPTGPTAPVTVTSDGGSTTTGTIPPGGGTVASPPVGGGVTQRVMVKANAGTPGGEVTIQIPDPNPEPCPDVCYGIPMHVTGFDTGSPSHPLILRFIFARRVIPASIPLREISMLRNEVEVPRCRPAHSDPCQRSIGRTSSGRVKIVIVSSDETDPRYRGH